ncbi:MAG: Maf family nucleotide pyrophosphatase [Bacteroidales bacterium]
MNNLNRYDIILASASPRRQELLKSLDINFRVEIINGIDESYPTYLESDNVALYISQKKAKSYQSLITDNQLVITADTIVVVDSQILGKPKDCEDAKCMLRALSGRTHKVITGVAITTADKEVAFDAVTIVEFAELTDDEIEYYVTRYNPADKAGSYGIQEWIGAIGVKSISGSYYNVMGLPLHRLYTELRGF